MMKKYVVYPVALLLFALIGLACFQRQSRVEKFWYGGYSDTIYAVLSGDVYEVENSKKVPLEGVMVATNENGNFVYSDKMGSFQIGLLKGIFSFIIKKDGYEPLRVENFVSDPDQVSHIQIILEKGATLRNFQLPDRNEP